MNDEETALFLEKARENLACAWSEYAQGRFSSCVNRAYYACYQAAIVALVRAGIRPPGTSTFWGHDFVQARFAGDLIKRRKRFPGRLRMTLSTGVRLRQVADYTPKSVSKIQALRACQSAQDFVETIAKEGETI